MRDVRELEEKIGYHFHDKNYLLTALTHSSYANEHKGECKYNERSGVPGGFRFGRGGGGLPV